MTAIRAARQRIESGRRTRFPGGRPDPGGAVRAKFDSGRAASQHSQQRRKEYPQLGASMPKSPDLARISEGAQSRARFMQTQRTIPAALDRACSLATADACPIVSASCHRQRGPHLAPRAETTCRSAMQGRAALTLVPARIRVEALLRTSLFGPDEPPSGGLPSSLLERTLRVPPSSSPPFCPDVSRPLFRPRL
jgi:hypothetical protein